MQHRKSGSSSYNEKSRAVDFDEPMNSLDKDGVKDIRQYLLDIKAQGKTILIASHSTEELMFCVKTFVKWVRADLNVFVETSYCNITVWAIVFI